MWPCPTTVSNVAGRYFRAETTKLSILKDSRKPLNPNVNLRPGPGRPTGLHTFDDRQFRLFMPPPLVSVIMATYNRSNILPYAVRCVLSQTLTDWELLVVGDACTDDTEAVMGTFTDQRVRFINLPQNVGE